MTRSFEITRSELREGAVVRFFSENAWRLAVVQTTPKPESQSVAVGAFRYRNGRMSNPRRIAIVAIQSIVKCALPEATALLPYWEEFIMRRGDTDATRRALTGLVAEARGALAKGGTVVGVSPGGVIWVAWNDREIDGMRRRLAEIWSRS